MHLRNVMGAKLTLDSGEVIILERLGKGMFHTCFLDPKARQVYSVTIERPEGSDYSKEILTDCEANPHIPVVEALGYLANSDRRVYRMPLYQPIRAAYSLAWPLLRKLIQSREDAWRAIIDEQVTPRKMRFTDIGSLVNQRVCELLDVPGVPQSLKDALVDLRDNACNYGHSYVFEFSRRNVMVDEHGTLILLDVLFDLETVERISNRKRQ